MGGSGRFAKGIPGDLDLVRIHQRVLNRSQFSPVCKCRKRPRTDPGSRINPRAEIKTVPFIYGLFIDFHFYRYFTKLASQFFNPHNYAFAFFK